MTSGHSQLADQDRRVDILSAASRIFSDKGYVATTTKDIGDAVGLDNSTLYYYIDSKESLLYQIVLSVYEPLGKELSTIDSEGGDAVVRLRRLVAAHLRGFANNVQATRVCFADWQHLQGEHFEDVRRRRAEYGRYVLSLIVEGQNGGLLNSELNPAVATQAVLSLLNSLNLWYDPANPVPIETITDNYLTIILTGLSV